MVRHAGHSLLSPLEAADPVGVFHLFGEYLEPVAGGHTQRAFEVHQQGRLALVPNNFSECQEDANVAFDADDDEVSAAHALLGEECAQDFIDPCDQLRLVRAEPLLRDRRVPEIVD